MIFFFKSPADHIFAVESAIPLNESAEAKLNWLFDGASLLNSDLLQDRYIGPRAAMITPWSTNAVEITQNMAIDGIKRIEYFVPLQEGLAFFDPMLYEKYDQLDQSLFTIDITPEPIHHIQDIESYNQQEGLALSQDEIDYLNQLSSRLGRPLSDSEVFGFSQVNSEHCRHKIFNGTFILDGQPQEQSLFSMIKSTSKAHPNSIVSAYKDNVAFVAGPTIKQLAPLLPDRPSTYTEKELNAVLSLKAETHNFPTTVEPFNGAATGSGGEIRDRLAGGQGSLPLAGTAVYMTAYSRLESDRKWEKNMAARPWLYQEPVEILIKASNGASDFGNKFGQPLIAGSVLTFEHEESNQQWGYDKVIMLAGGIGYGRSEQSVKRKPKPGDVIVVLGGDNYRIGMGGAAVSSADTGAYGRGIELNAVQRSNPEMQKRVANTIRALVESTENPIVSIHDHGAGGHLNCLSELVEEMGGKIYLDRLPIGDPTLSYKELVGNESQERMGLIIAPEDYALLERVARRERAPIYRVGEVTGDMRFVFEHSEHGDRPIDLELRDLFGSSPKTIMEDHHLNINFQSLTYDQDLLPDYLSQVLSLEAVACKDWLTNKVDRCVGGLVAQQQCVGSLQLPMSNVACMALDYQGKQGIATSIGHSPISGMIDPTAGSRNSIAEALTNLIWAPLEHGLQSVSLSANWMWPCRNDGEDARLYKAVEAAASFAIELGINIPTGKDSLSMAQKYPDGQVIAPGTVIISSVGHCKDIRKIVTPVLQATEEVIYYLDLSRSTLALGGSSFAQICQGIGQNAPTISDASYFQKAFNAVQKAIDNQWITSGHDISAGGLITALLEMCFPSQNIGADIDLRAIQSPDLMTCLFAENSGILCQAKPEFAQYLDQLDIGYVALGKANETGNLNLLHAHGDFQLNVSKYRQDWYRTSYLLDRIQTEENLAKERFETYMDQPLTYQFPKSFSGELTSNGKAQPIAGVLREQGSNSEREMANALLRAGFEVRDIHMTDLISGRETLEDIQFLGAVGGFSNSDVLGSAKGWAGSFLYNPAAKKALDQFFNRPDTLSIGICNGCQLFMELDMIYPNHEKGGRMKLNKSGKHESAFTSVTIVDNNSVMLRSLAGSRLGVWISHGEGRFDLPLEKSAYQIVAEYGYDAYPSNPNGSDYNVAMLCSDDGRHLVTMPHIERSFFAWNWAHYPNDREDEVSPWALAFVQARDWLLHRGS